MVVRKSLYKPSKIVCYDTYELGGFSYERKELVKQLIKEFDLKDTNDISNMLYTKGMSNCEIEDFIKNMYGTEVSPYLISRITDRILPKIRE